MKKRRKPQLFSATINGETKKFYDPTTPDNRNRPESDFEGAHKVVLIVTTKGKQEAFEIDADLLEDDEEDVQ